MQRCLCIANTLFRKAEKKCMESEVDFCMIGNVDRNSFKNVNVITVEFQHNLVVADIDEKPKKQSGSLKGKNEM